MEYKGVYAVELKFHLETNIPKPSVPSLVQTKLAEIPMKYGSNLLDNQKKVRFGSQVV